jgi:4-hydroxy-3-polyprenylbenzoate decarboxylase
VPASAEIVIEGFVEPGETVAEGPFGNHTGLYSPAGQAALMRITAISRQAGAIIPATVVGPPPMEDCWMAKSWERLLLAFLKLFVPAVSDLHFPLEWIFHQSAIISLENPNPAMVRETAQRLWSTPWFGAARLLIFTNSGSAPADLSSVAWKSINLSEFGRDLFSHADGKRWALDTTGGACKLPRIISDPETVQHIDRRWPEYGIPSP